MFSKIKPDSKLFYCINVPFNEYSAHFHFYVLNVLGNDDEIK